MFPIQDTLAYRLYKQQDSVMWVADELDYSIDAAAYESLPIRYKEIYKQFLGFFAPGDGVITAQAISYLAEARTYEETAFILAQLKIETTHSEAYGLAIVQVIKDEAEIEEVFDQIDNLDCIKNKAIFVEKWMNDKEASLGTRYLAGSFSEGVFFAALFALVFFFRRKNVFKTFLVANEFIMRDETIHRDFNAAMAKRYGGWTQEDAEAIARDAVAIEIGHLEHILATPIDGKEEDELAGLTIENITTYVKSLADQVLVLSGAQSIFNVHCSLDWMKDVGLHTKPNFYETKVINYAQLSVKGAMKAVEDSKDVEDPFGDLDNVDF